MKKVIEMIKTHPVGTSFNADELADCISECFSCAQTCKSCADACLAEDSVKDLVKCIRLNLDCADSCIAAGSILSRLSFVSEELLREQLSACKTACDLCGTECGKHQHHEHCKVCAESCGSCRDACDKMLSGISAAAYTT